MSVPVPDKLRNSHGAMVVWATVVQNKASSWPPSLQSTSPSPIRSYTSRKEPYYYCPGLPDNHPNKRIPVSSIERQLRYAQQLTAKATQLESSKGATYPHRFYNHPEKLNLTTNGPWLEFSAYRSGGFKDGGHAGAVRVIYPKSSRDGGPYDVVYHDPNNKREVGVKGGGKEIIWGFSVAVRQRQRHNVW